MRTAAWGAAISLVLVAVAWIVPDVPPADDFALFDLHLLDTLHGLQTTGAYSQYGWNHPGPAIFYLFAPLYWLGGFRHMAVVTMAAALGTGTLVAVLALVRRHGAEPGLTVATALMLGLFVARSWGLLASPWNPHVPIFLLALLLVAGAAAVSGDYRLIPAAAALASVVVQAHVGFAGPALAIGLTSAVLTVICRARPSGHAPELRPSLARAAGWAALVTAALWALPIVDAVAPGGTGNLQQIVRFFGDERARIEPGVADAAFAHYITAPVGPSLAPPFGETRLGDPHPALSVLWRVQAVLVASVAVAWWIRRRTFKASVATLSLAATLAAWFSVRQMPTQPFDYTVYWVSMLGVMNWTVIAAPVFTFVAARGAPFVSNPILSRWVWPTAVAALILTAGWQAAWWHARLDRRSGRVVRTTAFARAEMANAGATAPHLRFSHDAWGVAAGLTLQLVRDGARPTVDADWVRMFGSRQAPTGAADLTMFVGTSDDHREDLDHRTNYRQAGRAEDMYLYVVGPAPPSRVLESPVRLVDAFVAFPPAAARLPERAGQLPKPPVDFQDAGAYVTFLLPPSPLIGIRLRGEARTRWQLRCAMGDGEFSRIGRVELASGPGAQWGEAFLRTLAGCRELKIAPADNRPMWLDQLDLLEAAPPTGAGDIRPGPPQ